MTVDDATDLASVAGSTASGTGSSVTIQASAGAEGGPVAIASARTGSIDIVTDGSSASGRVGIVTGD